MNYLDLFPQLHFANEQEQKRLNEYCQTKGVYLHKQVYEALLHWESKTKVVSYEELSGLIRYDKTLRYGLYVYLSAAEEYLRAVVCEKLDVAKEIAEPLSCKILQYNQQKKEWIEETPLIEKKDFNHSHLYAATFSKHCGLHTLIQIVKMHKLVEREQDWDLVKELRNKVMHHNLLVLSHYTDRTHIEQEIASVEQASAALYRVLPNDGMRKSLNKAVNIGNFKDGDLGAMPNAKIMRLGRFENGVFTKI
ncbi:MAG: hypothetical protein FWD76_01575 [Firmicutes bacterium]|nr:hypothetical protein [Bacillota bacterium]